MAALRPRSPERRICGKSQVPEHHPGWRYHHREDRRQHREGVVVGGRWCSVGRTHRSAVPERTALGGAGARVAVSRTDPPIAARTDYRWAASEPRHRRRRAWPARAAGRDPRAATRRSSRLRPVSEHNLIIISLGNPRCTQIPFLALLNSACAGHVSVDKIWSTRNTPSRTSQRTGNMRMTFVSGPSGRVRLRLLDLDAVADPQLLHGDRRPLGRGRRDHRGAWRWRRSAAPSSRRRRRLSGRRRGLEGVGGQKPDQQRNQR